MLTPDQNALQSGESPDNSHFQRAVEVYAGEVGRVFDSELFPLDGLASSPLSGETLDALETWTADRVALLERRAWCPSATAHDSLTLREAQENLAAVREYRANR